MLLLTFQQNIQQLQKKIKKKNHYLIKVKNRHTLKRKSRITEMEAHLDEHFQHYHHPFIFQHHEK